ncbi:MAG: molybdopterin converting factor subunit 1 [Chrysiogenales bacterium]|nr:MAG: molybdopterin converting factor subunit 1 [Chrysiogenales bacterium]
MKIRIKAFASVRELCGFDEKELTVSEGITVRELLRQMKKNYRPLEELDGTLLFAVNEKYCAVDTPLADEDVLAIFPPVSGG